MHHRKSWESLQKGRQGAPGTPCRLGSNSGGGAGLKYERKAAGHMRRCCQYTLQWGGKGEWGRRVSKAQRTNQVMMLGSEVGAHGGRVWG